MSGMYVDGKWQPNDFPTDQSGTFQRQPTTFRRRDVEVTSKRYHLYVSLACPWAHRTLICRALLNLEPHLDVSIVDYFMGESGWEFSNRPGASQDHLYGAKRLGELYLKSDPKFSGRVTVPIMWDKQTQKIVNNESRDIMELLATKFATLSSSQVELYPHLFTTQVNEWIDRNYESINNGVYKCGFAKSQQAYEDAYTELFRALDNCEQHLQKNEYLCGEQLTAADIALFTTLIRFDSVYYSHFKCNRQHLYEFPNLWRFTKNIFHKPKVAETCNFDHIKRHYFESHKKLNPSGIVPKGPNLRL